MRMLPISAAGTSTYTKDMIVLAVGNPSMANGLRILRRKDLAFTPLGIPLPAAVAVVQVATSTLPSMLLISSTPTRDPRTTFRIHGANATTPSLEIGGRIG